MTDISKKPTFKSFQEFWPFYLSQHRNTQCRQLHFLGMAVALTLVGVLVFTKELKWIFMAFVSGYGLSWLGHFTFEKNRPATFKFPLYSLIGDGKMFWMMLTGKFDEEFQKQLRISEKS